MKELAVQTAGTLFDTRKLRPCRVYICRLRSTRSRRKALFLLFLTCRGSRVIADAPPAGLCNRGFPDAPRIEGSLTQPGDGHQGLTSTRRFPHVVAYVPCSHIHYRADAYARLLCRGASAHAPITRRDCPGALCPDAGLQTPRTTPDFGDWSRYQPGLLTLDSSLRPMNHPPG